MKIIKLTLLLLILSISISCDKDEEPALTLAQNLQNGIWEDNDNVFFKFDGTNITASLVEFDSSDPNATCISETILAPYTIESNIITLTTSGDTSTMKIVGDVLTIDNDTLNRRESIPYPDC